jgi:HEAT repeat protein
VKPRFIFILFVLGILGALIVCTRQPRYHGRTLTSWLQQCWDTSLMETQRLAEAQEAIRAIGTKKALPGLLKLVEANDDPVSLWIIDAGDKLRISDEIGLRFIRWHSALDFKWLGERGFEVLGTNAAPAAEALGKLLNKKFPDEENERLHILVIERCLESIGKPAEPVICRALTNQDAAIRQWAIDELASVTDDVEVYIARIKPRLQDSSDAVRGTAVNDIGIQTSAHELAVPLLISALKDSAVSANAANALGNFDTNALVAFPILTNLVEHGDANVAGAALKTLIVIAPDRALPIFTNYLVRGKPGINDALRALTEVMPDKALPMVLARLQSPNLAMRREAFGLLRHYPETSQIDSAMQTVVTDSDSALALAAKGFLTAQYATNHPDAFLFPDEPSYNGKRLGEWLETRIEGGGDFTPAAKDAIHQVGTNAIPALLKRLTYVRPPYCFNPFQININAAGGFIALSEQAKPALPELWLLMDSTNKDTALTAMIATCGTGSNAMPFLIKGLTNSFANVRGQAANILMEGVGDKFPEQRKQAIPLFVKLLNDPDDDVRMNATNQLKEIDSAAAAKAGIK